MTKLYSLCLILFIFLFSCKSAHKAFKKGDYTQTIELGVKKLQKDPYDYDTRDMVQKAYAFEMNEHEDQIRIISNSTSESKNDDIFQQYSHLQHLYETIHAYPAVAAIIHPKDYSSFLETYADKAAAYHMDRAARWMNEHTKLSAREGFKEYDIALRYRPDNFDLRKKRDMAYDMAVTKVIIAPMQNFGGYQLSTPTMIQTFQTEIIKLLSSNMNNDFIRFYTEWEARNKDIRADQVMELNLSRITIGQPVDEKDTRELSKQVVVKDIVYKPDSVVHQYGTVYAKVISIKRTLISQGDLAITVRDTQGRTVWNDHFTGQHQWQTQFATYTGDERALSDDDKNMCNKTDYNPPAQDKIMQDLLHQIQSDVATRLRGYYVKNQF